MPRVPNLSNTYLVHVKPFCLFQIHLILSYHLHLGLQSYLFPSGFPTKPLYAILLSHCVPHDLSISFFFYLTTLPIFGEEYSPQSSSLRNFILPHKTSSLTGLPFPRARILYTEFLSPDIPTCVLLAANKVDRVVRSTGNTLRFVFGRGRKYRSLGQTSGFNSSTYSRIIPGLINDCFSLHDPTIAIIHGGAKVT